MLLVSFEYMEKFCSMFLGTVPVNSTRWFTNDLSKNTYSRLSVVVPIESVQPHNVGEIAQAVYKCKDKGT